MTTTFINLVEERYVILTEEKKPFKSFRSCSIKYGAELKSNAPSSDKTRVIKDNSWHGKRKTVNCTGIICSEIMPFSKTG